MMTFKVRYREIRYEVNKLFLNFNLNSYPIKIKKLIKQINKSELYDLECKVVSYSKHMNRHNISYDELLSQFQSDEGCTSYDANTNKYIIYYNENKLNERIKWTIAHELGHVILKHHSLSDRSKLFRNGLSDSEYDWMEIESNKFASLLLANPVILNELNVNTELDIQKYCKISHEASKYRYDDLERWRRYKYINSCDRKILNLFSSYFNKNNCCNCNSTFYINNIKYCKICGKTKFDKGDGNMEYESININEHHKCIICPICSNENTNIEGGYCQICGTYITNVCTVCGNYLDGDARFCPDCGNKSTFLLNNILYKWDAYTNTVPVNSCPNCGTIHDKDVESCSNCGFTTTNGFNKMFEESYYDIAK